MVAVQVVHEPLVVLDEAGRIVMLNERLLTLTGFGRNDLMGASMRTLFPLGQPPYPRPDPVIAGDLRPGADGLGENVTVSVSRKDGSAFAARLISTPARSCMHGPIQVVTVRQAAQLTLEEIGLGGLLESAPDATLILDPDCRVVLANSRAGKLMGGHHDALDGRRVDSLFPVALAGEVHEWLHGRYQEALQGGDIDSHTTGFPVQVQRPNGDVTPVEIAVSALHLHEGMLLRAAFRDVSERLRLQTETELLKAHFLATISHELRTPLTSILGYTELLEDLDEADLGAQGRHFAHVIGRNAQRELRLVDDLLTLVTIGDGQLSLRDHSIDLNQVVLESIEALTPTADESGVRLSMKLETDDLHVIGDHDRLGQACDNLLSNAIKFSPPTSTVTIRVSAAHGHARVQVIDQGPGIPEHDRPRVFDRLYRGHQAIADEKPGAGLGLTIVKAIVNAHHGKIAIIPEHRGTSVEMLLPVRTPECLPGIPPTPLSASGRQLSLEPH